MLFPIFDVSGNSEKILREEDLVKDICNRMKDQTKKDGLARLLIYGGSNKQAQVLGGRVREKLGVSLKDYQVVYLTNNREDIKINPDMRLITVISLLKPDNGYSNYYQVSLEECLRLMGDPEYIFTHI